MAGMRTHWDTNRSPVAPGIAVPDTQIVADQVQPAKAQKRAAHTSRAKTNR